MRKRRNKVIDEEAGFIGLVIAGVLGIFAISTILWAIGMAIGGLILGVIIYAICVWGFAMTLTFVQCWLIGIGISVAMKLLGSIFSRSDD